MSIIKFFHEYEENGYLSNWYPCSFYDGIHNYCSTEQYMMAKKAEFFHDHKRFELILKSSDPSTIKNLGRDVEHYNDGLWKQIRGRVMLCGLRLKFQQNEELAAKLLDTGVSILAECSPYDDIWGIKLSADNEASSNPSRWKGHNLLGRTLMYVRSELNTPISSDYINRMEKVWNMKIGEAIANPVLYKAVKPYMIYSDYCCYKDASKHLLPATFAGQEFMMETNMGGGFHVIGFYEMKSDIYNLVKYGRV